MAEPDRTPSPLTTTTGVPVGLLEELRASGRQALRRDEVARARRRAADRAYDDGDVVEEIARRLLSLSDR